jgi:serine/threonine protein phosphatase PrpC
MLVEAQSDSNRFSQSPTTVHHSVGAQRMAIVKFCWRGKSHVEMGTECQDFAEVYPSVTNDDAMRLTLVVADGVGTRSRSRKGAEFACHAIGKTFNEAESDEVRLSDLFAKARARFMEFCTGDSRQHNIDHELKPGTLVSTEGDAVIEYATTALTLCLDKRGYWAASVGDGAIYGLSAGGSSARLLTKINREGFANEVRPLTNDQWLRSFDESDAEFILDDTIEGFCLMTDGLSESIGDADIYFGTVWPELKLRLNDGEALAEYAEAFCLYWEDHKFSDDDKTLVAVFLNP